MKSSVCSFVRIKQCIENLAQNCTIGVNCKYNYPKIDKCYWEWVAAPGQRFHIKYFVLLWVKYVSFG